MMMLLCFSLVLIALLFGLWWLKHERHRVAESAWRPRELGNARLLYAEKLFTTCTPFPLAAKVDRAYLADGIVVLVELKTRKVSVVYRSDIIELSAQRVAIEASTEQPVNHMAYVVIQHPVTGARSTHRVTLLSKETVIGLALKYEGLESGRLTPLKTTHRGLCAKCPFATPCQSGRSG
jgi:hypothetical protein